MKKIFIIIAALMLASCGTSNTQPDPTPSVEDSTNDENLQGKDNHKGSDESAEKEEDVTPDETDQGDTERERNTDISNEPAQQEPEKPQYQLTDVWSLTPIKDAPKEVVLITIDDAPDQYAVEMAKTLKENDVPAIFFVNGIFIEADNGRDKLKQIYNMGFEIGNHTYSHKKLSELSEEKQYEEIVSVNDLVEEITGERPKFFRAPFGVNTDYSKKVAEEEGMLVMNWSFGYDWNKEYMNEKALADIMVNTNLLGNGSNLLMHDREWTYQALDDIVTGLANKGFGFVNPDAIEVTVPDDGGK